MPINNKALFAKMHSAIALLPEMMQNHDVLCFVTTMFCIYFAAVDSMPYIHIKKRCSLSCFWNCIITGKDAEP